MFLVLCTISIPHGKSLSIDSIAKYSSILVRDSILENRQNAYLFLNDNLGKVLDESFSDLSVNFPELEGLSVLEDSARSIRVITYQLYTDTSEYSYGGWIQAENLNRPVFLEDKSIVWEMDSDLDYMEFSPENWYGTLYYQILPVKIQGKRSIYALFGFDNYHFYTKRKVIEFLVLDNGNVHFGSPLIEMEQNLPEEYRRSRFILDYAVQAPATLRFDKEENKVIFDHLIIMKSNYSDQKVMRVPDGTYSGFSINENGVFSFIEKLYNQTMEEAPGGRDKKDTGLDPILGHSSDLKKRGSKKRGQN